jgi:hypothetical protein
VFCRFDYRADIQVTWKTRQIGIPRRLFLFLVALLQSEYGFRAADSRIESARSFGDPFAAAIALITLRIAIATWGVQTQTAALDAAARDQTMERESRFNPIVPLIDRRDRKMLAYIIGLYPFASPFGSICTDGTT